MNSSAATRVPNWYWVASGLALVWALFGVVSYLMQVYGAGPASEAAMTEAQRAFNASIPSWVIGAFATAVFACLGGTIGLLLRKRWAKLLLAVSLIAIIIQFGWQLFLSDALKLMGNQAAVLPIVITLVAVALVWFANLTEKKGWLA